MLSVFDKSSATVKLADNGSYAKGEWTPSYNAATEIHIVTPQPLKANELQMLDAGERKSNYLKTWFDEKVIPREGLKDSAIVTYAGKDYLVYQVDDWNVQGNFYRIVMREITNDESRYRA